MTKSKRRPSRIELLYLIKVGKRLREVREKKGYSITDVIKHTNVQELYEMEKGKEIDVEKIFIVCTFYGIDITSIFNKRN